MAKADKVKEKVSAAKAKIESKVKKTNPVVKKTVALLGLVLLIAGCATSDPASRMTYARYEFGDIRVDNGSTFNMTLGDGALASADSSGSTESMTASPTNDVKPDIDVSVPINKAGTGQSVGSVLGDAVTGLIKGVTTKDASAGTADCPDGNCSESGTCSDGNCSE